MLRMTLAFLLVAQVSAANEPPYYRLSSADLACILDHLEIYRAMGDPAFVVTSKCPPDNSDSLLGMLTNEVPTPTFEESDGLDEFLALTDEQMNCLADLTLPEEAEVVRYYPDDCRIETEE